MCFETKFEGMCRVWGTEAHQRIEWTTRAKGGDNKNDDDDFVASTIMVTKENCLLITSVASTSVDTAESELVDGKIEF